jgi:predicted nucleic acid-binding protein
VPGVAYLDSSALVKLVVAETESWALGDYVRDRQVVSSDIARVEFPRSVRRLGLGEAAVSRAAELLRRITLLKLERTVLTRAAELEPIELRSLDAIDLASALSVSELEAFVTYDRRLATAAESAGLGVLAPV